MRLKDYLKSRIGFLTINGILFMIFVAILIFLNVGSGLIFSFHVMVCSIKYIYNPRSY